MDIQTKYELGQKVHSIREESTRIWGRCGFCMGSDGPVSSLNLTEVTGLDGETRRCPACRGNGGEWKYVGKTWVLGVRLTIGQLSVMLRKARVTVDAREEKYMCYETGVGSGTVWSVEKLFATEEAALAECNTRNSIA